MARRIAALFGFVAVIVLALTLLYRVYIHHTQAEPYVEEDAGAIVRMDASAIRLDGSTA
jgi:hypothetical protein